MVVTFPLHNRCQKGLIPLMFHSSKDEFLLPFPKRTAGEFFTISIPLSLWNTQLLLSWCNRRDRATQERKASASPHYTLTPSPPPLCTNSKTVFLVLGYLSLNSKELHSLWAEGSQIHFLPRWPSGSLALSMPSSFGKASSFSVSQSSPIVASFNCREKGKYLTQACRIVQVPGRKAFRVKPKLPLRDSKMGFFTFLKILSKISKSSSTVYHKACDWAKRLVSLCTQKSIYID